jgi:predicted GTPase
MGSSPSKQWYNPEDSFKIPYTLDEAHVEALRTKLHELEHGVERVNILILGPPCSGKSSFANTLYSIVSGENGRNGEGPAPESFTRRLNITPITDKIMLQDPKGYDEALEGNNRGDGYVEGLLRAMLEGRLKDRFDLNLPMQHETNKKFLQVPQERDKIHFVLLFQPLNQQDEALGNVRRLLEEMKISTLVVFTKVDLAIKQSREPVAEYKNPKLIASNNIIKQKVHARLQRQQDSVSPGQFAILFAARSPFIENRHARDAMVLHVFVWGLSIAVSGQNIGTRLQRNYDNDNTYNL